MTKVVNCLICETHMVIKETEDEPILCPECEEDTNGVLNEHI
jgi:hypothetical protein